jgi:hypothetical protein
MKTVSVLPEFSHFYQILVLARFRWSGLGSLLFSFVLVHKGHLSLSLELSEILEDTQMIFLLRLLVV